MDDFLEHHDQTKHKKVVLLASWDVIGYTIELGLISLINNIILQRWERDQLRGPPLWLEAKKPSIF